MRLQVPKDPNRKECTLLAVSTETDPHLHDTTASDKRSAMIRKLFAEVIPPDETILHVTPTDMTVQGLYRQGWLVLTDRRLLSLFEGDGGPSHELDLASVRGIDIEHNVGNGIMTVAIPDERVKFARFSRSALPRVLGGADGT